MSFAIIEINNNNNFKMNSNWKQLLIQEKLSENKCLFSKTFVKYLTDTNLLYTG